MTKGKKVDEQTKREILRTIDTNEADPTSYTMGPESIGLLYDVSGSTVEKIKRERNRKEGRSNRSTGFWLPTEPKAQQATIQRLKKRGEMSLDWQPEPSKANKGRKTKRQKEEEEEEEEEARRQQEEDEAWEGWHSGNTYPRTPAMQRVMEQEARREMSSRICACGFQAIDSQALTFNAFRKKRQERYGQNHSMYAISPEEWLALTPFDKRRSKEGAAKRRRKSA